MALQYTMIGDFVLYRFYPIPLRDLSNVAGPGHQPPAGGEGGGRDPHAPNFHHEGMGMVSVRDLDAALGETDCVAITTDHSVYDWGEIVRVASMVVHTRRVV